VLKRQIALQSDDIIKPTPDSDSPKKTYSEIMTDGNVLALAAAVRSAEQAEAFVSIFSYFLSDYHCLSVRENTW